MQLASGSVASQWQLARTSGDQVKQPIDLQLAKEMMTCAGHYLGAGWLCKAIMGGSGQLHNHQVGSNF